MSKNTPFEQSIATARKVSPLRQRMIDAGAPGTFEWCEFEERPGPAVDAQQDDGITIYLSYRRSDGIVKGAPLLAR